MEQVLQKVGKRGLGREDVQGASNRLPNGPVDLGAEIIRATLARGAQAVAGATTLDEQIRAMHAAGLMCDSTFKILTEKQQ